MHKGRIVPLDAERRRTNVERRPTDKRYKTAKWQRVRKEVLVRDLWRCTVVPGCEREGRICDHIRHVDSTTSDAEFFDKSGLRASCYKHNTMRGTVDRFEKEVAGAPAPRMKPLSIRRLW